MSGGPFLWNDVPWTWDGDIWGWDWEGEVAPDPVDGSVSTVETADTGAAAGEETTPSSTIDAVNLPLLVQLGADLEGVTPQSLFDVDLDVEVLVEAWVAPPTLPPPLPPPPIVTECRPRSPVVVYEAPHGQFAVLSDPPFGIPVPDLVGALTTGGELDTMSAPRQWGGMATAAGVLSRSMTMPLTVTAGTSGGLWQAREELAGLLAVTPSALSALPDLGRLRLERPGRPVVEAEVLPVDSPRNELQMGPRALRMELEFFAPDPRWREVDERHVLLASDGGFHGPLHGPFWSLGGAVTQAVNNSGTAGAPVLVRIDGPAIGPVVECVGVGALVTKVEATIPSGSTLVVDTTFLHRSVRLDHGGGTVENAAGLMDMAQTVFWELPRGASTLRLGGVNVSGASVRVSWRPHLVGV